MKGSIAKRVKSASDEPLLHKKSPEFTQSQSLKCKERGKRLENNDYLTNRQEVNCKVFK